MFVASAGLSMNVRTTHPVGTYLAPWSVQQDQVGARVRASDRDIYGENHDFIPPSS
jgi:hypothetical protein